MKTTLRDLLNIVFRFGRALIIFWVVALLAVVVYYTQSARKYESKARILVSLGSENAGKADYLNSRNLQLMQREQQIHNEQQILISDHVMQTTAKWILGEPTPGDPPPPMDENVAVARRFLTGLEPEPTPLLKLVKLASQGVTAVLEALPFGSKEKPPASTRLAAALSKSVEAKTIFNSDALDVTFRYRDPRVAQTVLKLVLAAYMDHHIAVFQSVGESDLLKSELDRSVDQYQKRLDEMATFMATHHVFAEDAQVNSFIEQRQQINQSLTEAQAENEASSARIKSFNSLNGSLKRYETYSTLESRNKLHDELESKLTDAQVQEQQILNSHPAGSRMYQDQVEVLRRLRELLATQPAQMIDQREDRRSAASELVETSLISATAAQKGSQARLEQLKVEQNKVNGSLNDYAKNLPGYDMIKLNLNFSKSQSEQMGQAFVNSRLRALTAQNAITDISVIDVPSWDPEPASPKKSMIMLISVALLVLGGAAVVLAGIGLDQTVGDRGTAERGLGLPVTAVLPLVQAESGGTPTLLEPQTEKEFARIYTSVRNIPTPGVVILLAGSKGGEGLSLIGYELARFLGRNAASPTALVDTTFHPVEQSVTKAGGPAILSLPEAAGDPRHSATEVTSAATPAALLTAWRHQYAYIVIASSAAKDLYKLVDILPSVDASYLVVEAGRTRRATAASTIDLLRSYGVSGLQLILNKRVFFVPEWIVRRI